MKKEYNYAKLFLILSLFFGTLLVILVPSFNSPDEETHFMYAYEISNGKIQATNKGKVSGHYIPNSIFQRVSKRHELIADFEKKYSYSEMYYDNLYPSVYDEKTFAILSTQTQPVIAYIAPVIGIKIASKMESFMGGKEIGVDVLVQFARFFSLFAYSIICYFAIKITPKFKRAFFAILLLPMSLFLRSMVTYDGFILAIVALVLANILNLIENDNCLFSKKYIILFIITGFVLFNVKMVYSIVFLGVFAISSKKFGDKKTKWKKIALIIIAVLGLTILRKLFYLKINANINALSSKQLDFVLHHPIEYLKILFYNIKGKAKLHSWWMLGTYGYLDTYVPVLFQFLLKIYLIVIILIDIFNEKLKISFKYKIGYLLLMIFGIIGIFTIMYISWTPVVLNKIGGSIIE